nr:hypothetical protein BSM_25830 [uncultured archaeon]
MFTDESEGRKAGVEENSFTEVAVQLSSNYGLFFSILFVRIQNKGS